MQLQTNTQGEALSKRKGRRMRKHEWRKKWLVMSEGSTVEAHAIKQLMRGPKLLSNAMPCVMPDVETLKAQGVVVGPPSSYTKFVHPVLRPNRRMKQRRKHKNKWEYPERRTHDRRTRIVQGKKVRFDRAGRTQKTQPDRLLPGEGPLHEAWRRQDEAGLTSLPLKEREAINYGTISKAQAKAMFDFDKIGTS